MLTRMKVHAAHTLYIHYSGHTLLLDSIQAAVALGTVRRMFGTMTNRWKLFYYSHKKAEASKKVQSVLYMPELKVVKPSDTRWLSHERWVKAIQKELPALIITLHKLYDDSGDADAYGQALAFSYYCGLATINLLVVVFDLLPEFNWFMQRKETDLNRLPIILKSIVSELKHLNDAGAEWYSLVETSIVMLVTDRDITMRRSSNRSDSATTVSV